MSLSCPADFRFPAWGLHLPTLRRTMALELETTENALFRKDDVTGSWLLDPPTTDFAFNCFIRDDLVHISGDSPGGLFDGLQETLIKMSVSFHYNSDGRENNDPYIEGYELVDQDFRVRKESVRKEFQNIPLDEIHDWLKLLELGEHQKLQVTLRDRLSGFSTIAPDAIVADCPSGLHGQWRALASALVGDDNVATEGNEFLSVLSDCPSLPGPDNPVARQRLLSALLIADDTNNARQLLDREFMPTADEAAAMHKRVNAVMAEAFQNHRETGAETISFWAAARARTIAAKALTDSPIP